MKSTFEFSQKRIAQALLVVAALVSGYLAFQSFTASGLAGCGEGAACNQVLTSQWAKVFGLPVALLGSVLYLVTAFFHLRGKMADTVTLALPLAILLAAAWFVSVQLFAIGEFCIWCCSAHLLASVAAVLLLIARPRAESLEWMPATGALASVVALAIVQSFGSAGNHAASGEGVVAEYTLQEAAPVQQNEVLSEVSLAGGKAVFRLDELPLVGVSQPKNVVVALTDYTCPHCRKLHDVLTDIGVSFGGDMAILKLPATRAGTDSAKIHRYMLALWKVNPKVHWTLERSLIEGRVAATAAAVQAEAIRLIGGSRFSEANAEHNRWISDQLANTRLVQDANELETGERTLPQVMIGGELVLGAHPDPKYYLSLVEKELGVVPVKGKATKIEAMVLLQDGETIDLGVVQPGIAEPIKINFKNHDSKPFLISWLNMSADLSLESFTEDDVWGSKLGELQLTLQLPEDAAPGLLTRTVTVNSNSGHRAKTFRVKAVVEGAVAQVLGE